MSIELVGGGSVPTSSGDSVSELERGRWLFLMDLGGRTLPCSV